ncbi:hypothetical protein MASR1M12_09220 [Erysipelotrichia bacterium]
MQNSKVKNGLAEAFDGGGGAVEVGAAAFDPGQQTVKFRNNPFLQS